MNQNIFVPVSRVIMFILLLVGPTDTPLFGQTTDSLDLERLEKEIGQMLMVGIRGTHLNAKAMDQTRQQITDGEIGGIIFFKHNIKNSRQFKIFVRSIVDLPVKLPLLLAIDEEGGKVRRLKTSQGFDEFPSAAHIGSKFDLPKAYKTYSKMAQQIRETGLNLNLGPVVDVNINRASPAIGQLNRSYSRNPGTVYNYSSTFIRAHHDSGVLTTLKHYPGHGSSREDTHKNLTDITHTWRTSEQLPFKRLIESAQVDLIMSGHLFDKNLDQNYPASLSQVHIQKTLRDELGYEGVVITDDLQMGAIIKNYKLDDIIVSAVNAGCDILQFSDPMNLDENLALYVRNTIMASIHAGDIQPDTIHRAYERITILKTKLSTKNLNQAD